MWNNALIPKPEAEAHNRVSCGFGFVYGHMPTMTHAEAHDNVTGIMIPFPTGWKNRDNG